MGNIIDIAKKQHKAFLKAKNDIEAYVRGGRNGVRPDIRVFQNIGASKLFHEALMKLKESEDGEYLILKMLDSYEHFNHLEMTECIYKLRNIPEQSTEQKAIVAINTIFLNANNCCFDDSIYSAIDNLEELIFKNGYLAFEALENLMQELEHGDKERLNRYIVFLKRHNPNDWEEFCNINTALFNHYRRSEDFINLNTTLSEYQQEYLRYKHSETEKMHFEINLLRMLFECRNGRWEEYSIQLFWNANRYLDGDFDVAYHFANEFVHIVRDGAEVYGRYLSENAILEVSAKIDISFERTIEENNSFFESLPLEMLYIRRHWIEVKLLKAQIGYMLQQYDTAAYYEKKTRLQNQILNLCKLNGNDREYLHWLLCFSDDINSFRQEIDVKIELREKAQLLNKILQQYNFSACVAYYLIFLCNIWDALGEGDKAKEVLLKFDQSGANVKVFNIGVQKIYERLELKYKTGNQTDRQKLILLIDFLSSLNTNREIEEALIRATEALAQINFDDDNQIAALGPEIVTGLLLSCAHIFNNANRFDYMDSLWSDFQKLRKSWKGDLNTDCEIILNYAVSLFRRGNFDDSANLTSKILKKEISEILRLRALMLLGDIESAMAWPKFRFNSLTDALVLAEKLELPAETALIYHKLSNFLGSYYPALALSFLRKAEAIYEKLGMVEDLYQIYLLRAQASMNIDLVYSIRYDKTATPRHRKTMILWEEAKRLLKEYPRSVYKSESSRAFHDRIYGIITDDIDKILDAFYFYKRIGAYKDACLSIECAVITSSRNGWDNTTIDLAKKYLNYVLPHGDQEQIERIKGMVRAAETPNTFIVHPYTPSPYNGKTLFDILDKIAFDEELWALDTSVIRKHFPYPKDEDKFIPEANASGETTILSPVCLIPGTYYRGQNAVFQPCYPALYRKYMTDSMKFLERLRYCEFHLLLETHPLCTVFRNHFKFKYPDGSERVLNFQIYHLALAQHYGIATELMDVTSDKWVAAFFASTECKDDIYSPYKKSGEGVFYTCVETNFDNPIIRPIGLQPFSRPGEQRGYAFPLNDNDDFEAHVVKAQKFIHVPEINEFIFAYTNRSLKLFPYDILKHKADIIRKSTTFSNAALDMAVRKFYPSIDPTTIQKWIVEQSVSFTSNPLTSFTAADMDKYKEELPVLKQKIIDRLLFLNLKQRMPDGTMVIHATRGPQ